MTSKLLVSSLHSESMYSINFFSHWCQIDVLSTDHHPKWDSFAVIESWYYYICKPFHVML